MPSDSVLNVLLPALAAAAVLDGFRYVVSDIRGDGTAVLTPADDTHDRTTVVRLSELTYLPAVGVWTLPGRLLAKKPAGVAVTTEDAG